MLAAALDHLWQSTLIALGAALLTIPLRRAAAAVRYGLWFTASVKFLVPFAALAALGRLLEPALRSPSSAAPEAMLIERAAAPLARFPFSPAPSTSGPLGPVQAAAHAGSAAAHHLDLTLALVVVWALGSGVVLAGWLARWVRVRRIVRSARPLDWPAPMPVLASSSLMEPGLVGLWRPVLVIPESLPDHLAQPEIDAILAHEACHMRRRDNLTAAMHMLAEALFWFHPLVWWLGARLIAERERACDEAVVGAGHDRAAYARSLVESCRLYLQSPLSCVAGASGSNLKARVQAIMTAPAAPPLSRPAKALLLAAGACALATPVAAGLLTSPEGRTVVARAAALIPAPTLDRTGGARPDDPALAGPLAQDERAAAKAITLARATAVLAPTVSVAGIHAAPVRLARDIALPPAEAAPGADAPPTADPMTQAASFVESYAATSNAVIARWRNPLCVRVVGLTAQQAAAVRARVEQVAKAAGLDVQSAGCQRSNIEVGFTTDPQHMLDGVIASYGHLLGDRTSGTKDARTVTQPIQAWYQTNEGNYAANGAGGLKALVSLQYNPQNEAGYAQWMAGQGQAGNERIPDWGIPGAFPTGAWGPRQFLNVFVIVDLRRTGKERLGLISDYVTMLALSQPRSLGRCNVLPSVTDLFADACPGRAPEGLTAADVAYLGALYATGSGPSPPRFTPTPPLDGTTQRTSVVERMAKILATTTMAAN
jgi:beta-lactamase regulating signal transducer with metallopeptidase domain